jgi:hypothetical protein
VAESVDCRQPEAGDIDLQQVPRIGGVVGVAVDTVDGEIVRE